MNGLSILMLVYEGEASAQTVACKQKTGPFLLTLDGSFVFRNINQVHGKTLEEIKHTSHISPTVGKSLSSLY